MAKKKKAPQNGNQKKGTFGVTEEQITELRKDFRAACKAVDSEDALLSRLPSRFNDVSQVMDTLHINMSRSDYGAIRNVIRKMKPKRIKVNKYKPQNDQAETDNTPEHL